jgi:uncharacterized protein
MDAMILNTQRARPALLGYLALWSASTLYLAKCGADWTFPIISFVIFGVILSSIIWLLTRKMLAPDVVIIRPKRESQVARSAVDKHESLALLGFLLLYAILFLGVAFGPLKSIFPPGKMQEIWVTSIKLVVHVVLPAGLILALGGELRSQWTAGFKQKGFYLTLLGLSALLIGLLALVSPALKQISALQLAPWAAVCWFFGAWAWVSIEAGLCEEFLFRALLQTRLTAWLQSPLTAILMTSVIFALCHVPGLYLRGTPDTDGYSTNLWQVAAFTIATLSPLSVALGVLWQRSRSLLLVVLVHGAIDALPFTAEFVKIWGSP